MNVFRPDPFKDKTKEQWKCILAGNKAIAIRAGIAPEKMYHIGRDATSSIIDCSSLTDAFAPMARRMACERWLEEKKKDYPGLTHYQECSVHELDHYPSFHLDWNVMMEAWRRLTENKVHSQRQLYSNDMGELWLYLAAKCGANVELLLDLYPTKRNA